MNIQRSKYTVQTIISNEPISKSSAILGFRKTFNFKAGQVIGITTDKSITPRMYSIASGENDENIEILYKIVPNGLLTHQLWNLKPGIKIFISEPFGKFITNSDQAWFIATGTGIAPYISMIRSGYGTNKIMVHGSRAPEDFYFSNWLEQQLKENYIRCCTGAEEHKFFKGRVTDYLNHLKKIPINNKYYLCGSAEMVVDTRQILIDKGISFQNILSEIYF